MRASPTILVADDDPAVRMLLKRLLESRIRGASVVATADPDRVLELAAALRPRLIFLDWVFPGGRTGPAICGQLKRHPSTRRTPVVLMTGQRTGLPNRIQAVGSGADLYLAKPFTVQEAVGYARALLGKSRARKRDFVVRRGPLTLDRSARAIWWGTRRLPTLPPRLFELLRSLARQAPNPLSSRELLREVWGGPTREAFVKVAVERLRRKLKACGTLRIESVPGAGYRLIVPQTR